MWSFDETLTNEVVSFEQRGAQFGISHETMLLYLTFPTFIQLVYKKILYFGPDFLHKLFDIFLMLPYFSGYKTGFSSL